MLPDFADSPAAARAAYELGQAHAHLAKHAGDAVRTDALSGRLYFSRSGWLLLSVPNALGRGAFDALDEAGVELPTSGTTGQYNAHITVARPDEIAQIGGPDKITERGHSFRYTLGPVKTVEPKTWSEVSRVWYVTVESPELKELRRSYGLTPLPNNNQHDFHITIGVRKKNVLKAGPTSKAAAREKAAGQLLTLADGTTRDHEELAQELADKLMAAADDPQARLLHNTMLAKLKPVPEPEEKAAELVRDPRTGRVSGEPGPEYAGPRCPACGSAHVGYPRSKTSDKHCNACRHRWTDGGNNAATYPDHFKAAEEKRGPEAEYCPHCDARLERDPDSGTCNRCGKAWPGPDPKAAAAEKLAALICLDDLPKGPHAVCGACGSPNFNCFGSGACEDCGSAESAVVGPAEKAAAGLLGALRTAAGRPGVSNLLAMRRPVPLLKNVATAPAPTPAPASRPAVAPPAPTPVRTTARVVGGRQLDPGTVGQMARRAGGAFFDNPGTQGVAGALTGGGPQYAAVRAGAAPVTRRHELVHAMADNPASAPARMPLLWRGARWAGRSRSPLVQDVGTILHETAAHAAEARTLPGQVYQGARFLLTPARVADYGAQMNTRAGAALLAAPAAATVAGAGAAGYAGAAALKRAQ